MIYRRRDRFLAGFGASASDAGAGVILSGVQELGEVGSWGGGGLGERK
jgi:hypothetical protein